MPTESTPHASLPPGQGLSRLRIGPRLVLSTALPLVMFAIFSVWLWQSLGIIRVGVTTHLTQEVEVALLAKDMSKDVVQVQQYLQDISATRGQDGLDDGFDKAAESRGHFLQSLARFEAYHRAGGNARELADLAHLREDFDAYYAAGVAMARAYVEGGPAQGNLQMAPFDRTSEALQEGMDKLVDGAIQDMQNEVKGVADEAQLLRQTAMALCVVVMVLTLLLSWRITRSIVRPLQEAMRSLGRVAQGDLAFEIAVRGRDEVAQLMDSLKTMQGQLRGICLGVRTNAEQVASASEQIATGNQDLSVRTEEQATALQQTAASMEELGTTVRQSADSAQEANQLAQAASDVAVKAGEAVHDMVQTMQGINESSRRIGDIIGVIDGIAFQTNILALNAAVEAARAGEQGRGFAVVAAEVRSLAGRSAEAAREIKSLITDSVERVASGSAQVAQAGSTITEAVDAIQRVTTLMSGISLTTRQQQQGIGQIDTAVHQMDSATQQNAALVEESAAAAHSLSDQAQHLLQLTSVFRLGQAVPA